MHKQAPVAGKPLLLATAIASVIALAGCSTSATNLSVRPLQKAIGLSDRKAPSSNYGKGREYFRAGKYGLALQVFEKELAAHPHSVMALNGIGAVYDKLERYDLAVSYYYRALQLDPDSVQVLGNLGYSFLLQDRPEAARGVLELAASIQPDNVVVARHLAMASAQMAGLEGERHPVTVKARPATKGMTPAQPVVIETPSAPPVAVRQFARVVSPDYSEVRQEAVKPMEAAVGQQPTFQPEGRTEESTLPAADRPLMAHVDATPTVQAAEPDADESDARAQASLSPASKNVAQPMALVGHPPTQHDDVVESEALAQGMPPPAVAEPRRREAAPEVAASISLPESGAVVASQDKPAAAVIYHELPQAISSVGESGGKVELAFDTPEGTVEISNGNGYQGMARLLSSYYAKLGQQVAHVTNAAHFNHARTVIFYRAGKRDVAEALRTRLPVTAALRESSTIRSDTQVVLGKDIGFYQGAIRRMNTSGNVQKLAFAPLDASIEVSNGNGRRGMAGLLARVLSDEGDIVSRVTNADHFLYPTTRIFYTPGQEGEAKALAARLPVEATLIAMPRDQLRRNVDVRVIIGHDFLRYERAMQGLLASMTLKAETGV